LSNVSQGSLVELREESATRGMRTTPPLGSSEEFWAMRVCVTQRTDGNEEDYGSCKVCALTIMMSFSWRRSRGQYMCQQPR
jgi:hypothetical protein